MAERWNTLVTLSYGDEDGPVVQVYVPVDDEYDEAESVDSRIERVEAAALDALRPFLNNRTHFDATVYLPLTHPATAPSNCSGAS